MTHKIRVHELAKEYEISNKKFIELIKDMGVDVSSHLAGLSEEQVQIIRTKLSEKKAAKGEKAATVEESKEESKKDKKKKSKRKEDQVEEEDDFKVIKVKGDISVKDFSKELGLNATELVKKLFLKGQILNINSSISFELAEEIAMEYECLVEREAEEEVSFGDKFNLELEDSDKDLEERAPV